jgi:hypothetical protein
MTDDASYDETEDDDFEEEWAPTYDGARLVSATLLVLSVVVLVSGVLLALLDAFVVGGISRGAAVLIAVGGIVGSVFVAALLAFCGHVLALLRDIRLNL